MDITSSESMNTLSAPLAKRQLSSTDGQQNGFCKSLLFYLKTNANPRLLLKLMQASKYFCFKEFPFFVIQNIRCCQREWSYLPLRSDADTKYEKYNMDEISKKLWITQSISVLDGMNTTSELISRMAVCNIRSLFLQNQEISLDELKFLVNDNLKDVHLNGVTVTDLYGKPLLIEKVLQQFINVLDFTYDFENDFSSQFSSNSTKNIMAVLKESNIQSFSLFKVPQMFDIAKFFQFMKKNPQIRFRLCFRNGLTDAYKLQAYENTINAPYLHNAPITIRFCGQPYKSSKLKTRFNF